MRNILIITEGGVTAEKLKELLVENGEAATVQEAEILMDAGEEFDYTTFDTLVYFGKNSDYVQKAFDKAKYHGYGKAVLAVNALAYFARTYPDKKLAEKHQFISDCVNAEKTAIGFRNELNVSIAELPFLSGEYPSEFVTTENVIGFDCKRFYFAPDGGTAEISAENAAFAVYAVMENGENAFAYPICDTSRKYKAILQEKVGSDKKVYEYPAEFSWLTALLQKKKLKDADKEPEFNLRLVYKELLLTNLFFDAAETKKALQYEIDE